MVQKAMTYIDSQNDKQKKFQLIDTLRTVTLGKVVMVFSLVIRLMFRRFMSKLREQSYPR